MRAPPRIIPLPRPGGESPPGPRTWASWPWLKIAIVPVALGIGVLAGIFHNSKNSPGHPVLNLRAYDHGGQVRIEWDRSAAPIVSGGKASLFITDGDQALVTEVSPELLHDGSIVYQRKASNVVIRLSVTGAGSSPVQEWTRLMGLSAAPSNSVERAEAGDRATPPFANEPTAERQVAAQRPSGGYHGPTTGRLIWNGNLNAGASLEIDGGRASTGHLTGRLPEAPVKVKVHPANFSRRGIEVSTDELPSEKESRQQASAANGWTATVYRRDPKRAGDVVVTETPSARNKWKRIGLRAGARRVSVIVVDWKVTPRGR
jgi:hypothetical protein